MARSSHESTLLVRTSSECAVLPTTVAAALTSRLPRMERVIPLEGGLNFRDLGGYETRDGRRVRWRRLFRSGVMSRLTAADEGCLHSLGIRALCDLRTRRERERETVRWIGENAIRLEWDYDPRHLSLRSAASAPGFSARLAHSAMVEFYRALPSLFAPQYGALFAQLAAGTLPLVFGCSAGKDRTGMAAALILTSLGVAPEDVLLDFTLTDRVADLERFVLTRPHGSLGLGEQQSYLRALSPEVRAPLLRAAPEYLNAAFEQIKRDHGSLEGYLHDQLHLRDDSLTQMRAHLLEDLSSRTASLGQIQS